MRRFTQYNFYIVTFLLLCISVIIPSCVSCEEVSMDSMRHLSLKDAVQIAFLNNYDIQIQEQEIEYAKANVLNAVSEFMPKVDVVAAYTYKDAVVNTGPTSLTARKDTNIFYGYKNDNQLGLTLKETVFDGGANIANFKQSKLQLRSQKEALRAKKLDVAFEAKRLYYGLLLAYETERIARDLVEQARAHYDDVKTRFEQGTSSKFDLLQSKVQVSKTIPELVKASNSVSIITADLKKLLAIKLTEKIALKGRLRRAKIEIKEEEFLKKAYIGNPYLVLKLLGIDIKRWGIEYAKSGYFPQINGAANYNYRAGNLNNMFNSRHDNWDVGIRVSNSIFDGFLTKSKVDEAKARYEQEQLGKENLADQIAVDIKQACLDMEKAEAVIQSQKDGIVEARDALRISEIGYDNGVTKNLDVLDSQVSLAQVEQNLAGGIYDYVMAKAQLDRTMGEEALEEAENEEKD